MPSLGIPSSFRSLGVLRNSKPLPRAIRLAIFSLLAASVSIFGYRYFASRFIPAYGTVPQEMAYLKKADPRTLLGGDLTHFMFGTRSYSQPAPNLPWQLDAAFNDGDGLFSRPFKAPEKSAYGVEGYGLGPYYNNNSCEGCHRRDGVTDPRQPGSLLVRLSIPGVGPHGGPNPHPVYGGQFQDRAVPGVSPQGRVDLDWTEIPGVYPDGKPYSLRRPSIELRDLAYGPLGQDTMLSLRMPPPVFGIGLLEAIPDKTLLAWAAENAGTGGPVRGHPNMVWDPVKKKMAIGRFGRKAEESSVLSQTAGAAINDMGVTSWIHPEQTCTASQTACRTALPSGPPEQPEFETEKMDNVTTYMLLLGVPGRGNLDDAGVQRGEALFGQIGCSACHRTEAVTGNDHPIRRLRNQTIRPYTDLLLHDMGDGLADNRPSFEANGREWRTPALWGLGLRERVDGHQFFLHDGRARGPEEAVLWHGGEADAAAKAFRNLEEGDRAALIRFLKSL
jgi:CxxC motif-containing protein (DUF1111 family)